jgi:hypothetical protein
MYICARESVVRPSTVTVSDFWQHGLVTITTFYSRLDEVLFVHPEGGLYIQQTAPDFSDGFAHPDSSTRYSKVFLRQVFGTADSMTIKLASIRT